MRFATRVLTADCCSSACRSQLLQPYMRRFLTFNKGWLLTSCIYMRRIHFSSPVPCELGSSTRRRLYWPIITWTLFLKSLLYN